MNLATQATIDSNEQVFWEALQNRDVRFDGTFVYAVSSTRVYCRPTCPSRRPDRQNVTFFLLPEDAEAEGFRACRRCRPKEESSTAKLVQKTCSYIEANLDQPVRLSTLAKETGVSPHHLHRVFKRNVGITPRQYADSCRLKILKSELKEGSGIVEALYGAGYSSPSRLYEQASSKLGMTPRAYVRGGLGMRIHYTIVDSPLGRLLLAATERGISAVTLGEQDSQLFATLKKEYPKAEILPDSGELTSWTNLLLQHLQGNLPDLKLPMDVQATAFQRQVWEELQKIPYGKTSSYQEIAKKLGKPDATRAVARACATNPAAVVIPCHRVVREDGALGGYRWGIKRKEQLLERERKS